MVFHLGFVLHPFRLEQGGHVGGLGDLLLVQLLLGRRHDVAGVRGQLGGQRVGLFLELLRLKGERQRERQGERQGERGRGGGKGV